MKRSAGILFFLFTAITLFGQGEAAINYLNLPFSPVSAANGWTGVSGTHNDPLSFYYNPARLGFFESNQNFSGMTQFEPVDYLGVDVTSDMKGMKLQQDLSDFTGLPLMAGIGFIHGKVDYGNTWGREFDVDKFNQYSIGALLDYKVKVGFGLGIKSVDSRIGEDAYAGMTLFDFGLYTYIPIDELVFGKDRFTNSKLNNLRPVIKASAGYSLTNVGGRIKYEIESRPEVDLQPDPVARTARYGYTFTLGAQMDIDNKPLNLFGFSFTAETDDILVENGTAYRSDDPNEIPPQTERGYTSIFGDIKPFKNLLMLEGDEQVTVHKGYRFDLFETFTYMFGSMNDTHGYVRANPKSEGYVYSTRGFFRLWAGMLDKGPAKWVLSHVNVSYYEYYIFKEYHGISTDKKMEGLQLELINIVSF